MSYLPQTYRSNKRLAQLVKQEPKSTNPQTKQAVNASNAIQTRQASVKVENIQQTQNTRSKSAQREVQPKQTQQLTGSKAQQSQKSAQIQVKQEPITQTKNNISRSTSALQQKSQAKQPITNTQSTKQKQNEQEEATLTQSRKRGYQESQTQKNGANNQKQPAKPSNLETSSKSQFKPHHKQATQKDIDLEDLLLSQKSVKRCTKQNKKDQQSMIKEESQLINITHPSTQKYESITKRQKTSHQEPILSATQHQSLRTSRSKSAMRDLSQITTETGRSTRQSRSKTPKIEQPQYYTQVQTTTNARASSRSRNNQNQYELTQQSSVRGREVAQVAKDAMKNTTKSQTPKSQQKIKVENDDHYDLIDLLPSQKSTRTSQRQQTQKSTNTTIASKTATQTQKTIVEQQQTQKSVRTERSSNNRSSSRHQPEKLTEDLSTQRQTRSSKVLNDSAHSQKSKSPLQDKQQTTTTTTTPNIKRQSTAANSKSSKLQQSSSDIQLCSSQTKKSGGSRRNRNHQESLIKDIVKIEEPLLKQENQDVEMYYEPMTCSQLIDDSKPSIIKEQKTQAISEFQVNPNVNVVKQETASNVQNGSYLDELILFGSTNQATTTTSHLQQQINKTQPKQQQPLIIATQTESELDLEEQRHQQNDVDMMMQYDADYSQAATKFTQKCSMKELKKNLQIKPMITQRDQDIMKLENELETFERKQQQVVIKQEQQPIDMIKPRQQYPPASILKNSMNYHLPQQQQLQQQQIYQQQQQQQFAVPNTDQIFIKRTPTSIYNHAPIAYIKEVKDEVSSIQQNSRSQHQRSQCFIEEEKKQENPHVNVQNQDPMRTPQKATQPENNLKQLITLNLLSKETLESIRRAVSNKPTPSQSWLNSHQNNLGGPIRYSSSNKRINSDKPTPVLSTKLNELRNSANINGGVLLGSNNNHQQHQQLDASMLQAISQSLINYQQQQQLCNMSEQLSNVGNNGTMSVRYGGKNNPNDMSYNMNTTPRGGMQSKGDDSRNQYQFNLSNMQSAAQTPFKERIERVVKEEDEQQNKRVNRQLIVESEQKLLNATITNTSTIVIQNTQQQAQVQQLQQVQQQNNQQRHQQQKQQHVVLNPQVLTQRILERQQIDQVIDKVREDRKEDTRENSIGNQTPSKGLVNLNQDVDMVDESKIKDKKPQTVLEKQTQKLLSGIPMSEKYSDLLGDTKSLQLTLPAHYKQLLNLFSSLDQTLNFLRVRKQALTFSNIQKTVQQSLRKNFAQNHFSQMLHVAPFMYNHKWEPRNRGYELIIEIPKNIRQILSGNDRQASEEAYEEQMFSDIIEKRKQYFQDRLLNMTYKHYLKSKEQHKDVPKYEDLVKLIDPLTQNQWPVFFDPHSVPEIPRAQLKEQPRQSKSQTVTEFITQTNIIKNTTPIPDTYTCTAQNKTVQSLSTTANSSSDKKVQWVPVATNKEGKESPLVQLLTQDDVCAQSVSTAAVTSSTARTNTSTSTSSRLLDAHLYLSQDLISKIKQKQNRIEYNKQLNLEYMERQDQQKLVESYKSIMNAINMQFMIRSTNTMQMRDLVQVLDDKYRGHFNTKDSLIDQVSQIAQILPEWISLFNSPMGGQHIKIKNKKLQVVELIGRVETYLKQNMKQVINQTLNKTATSNGTMSNLDTVQ